MAHRGDGALLLGRYRLTFELGRGGAGIVYGARDEQLFRDVAVKVLQGKPRVPQAAARMAREAQALADVQHRNLVHLLDYGVADGAPCLVMELIDGLDLKRLCRHHPCSVAETLVILDQTLAALEACHARGYVHRDLKPGNVLVQRGDGPLHVKLIDFGIVQIAGDAGATALTVQGQIFGSLRYMAPEQWTQAGVGPRTDLYAVALLGYWLLAGGEHFIPAAAPQAIYLAHTNPRTRPRPTHGAAGDPVPPGLLEVLARACAPRPKARFPDATQMRAALAPLLPRRPVHPPPTLTHALDEAPTAPVPRVASELKDALAEAARGPGSWAEHAPSADQMLAATVVDERPSGDGRGLGVRLNEALVHRSVPPSPTTATPPAEAQPRTQARAPAPEGDGVPWWLLLAAAAGLGGLAGLVLSQL